MGQFEKEDNLAAQPFEFELATREASAR